MTSPGPADVPFHSCPSPFLGNGWIGLVPASSSGTVSLYVNPRVVASRVSAPWYFPRVFNDPNRGSLPLQVHAYRPTHHSQP